LPGSTWSRPGSAGSRKAHQGRRSTHAAVFSAQSTTAGGDSSVAQALQEELDGLPLGPRSAEHASRSELLFARALGLENSSVWPVLPQEARDCKHGYRCCWWWLARAALEEIASHTTIPEPTSLAMSDLIVDLQVELEELSELRTWSEGARKELTEAATNREELRRLRHAIADVREEAGRKQEAEAAGALHMAELSVGVKSFQAWSAHLRKEVELLEPQVDAEKRGLRVLIDGDVAAARHRVHEADKALTEMHNVQKKEQAVVAALAQELQRAREERLAVADQHAQLLNEHKAAVAAKARRRKAVRARRRARIAQRKMPVTIIRTRVPAAGPPPPLPGEEAPTHAAPSVVVHKEDCSSAAAAAAAEEPRAEGAAADVIDISDVDAEASAVVQSGDGSTRQMPDPVAPADSEVEQ